MREGMKLFTDFTNRWKGNSEAKRKMFSDAPQILSLNNKNVDSIVPENQWSKVTRSIGGNAYKPNLPVPKQTDPLKQIKFNRKISEIKLVSQFIFDDDSFAPTDVGNYCFEHFLERAKK
jgi:hypothetical protein